MSTRIWLPSDEQHLVQVREAAGVDHLKLSRRCLLSLGQIQELEGKGYGNQFYSEAIKFTAGSRVLTALGAETLPAPESPPADEHDIPVPTQALATSPSQTANTSPSNPLLKTNPIEWQTTKKVAPKFKLLGLLLVVILLILAGSYGINSQEKPVTLVKAPAPQPVPAPVEPVAPAAKPPAPAASVVPQKVIPSTSKPAVLATVAPATTTNSSAPSELDCTSKFNTSKQVVYQPQSPPNKPGNYVYFVARSPNPVCVLDGNGKVFLYNLKPGQNRSHFGTPPFKVWHPDATMVVMYYRGWRVTGQAAQAGVTVLQP